MGHRVLRRSTGWTAAVLCLLSLATGGPLDAGGRGDAPKFVYRARIEGVINPFSARYLKRAIHQAEREAAAALVVEIDSPGGLETAMRSTVRAELNSRAPVIVYVSPSGARAASAGMFIVLAAHLAAMAPGTNIGGGHPVSLIGGDGGEGMEAKVSKEAAALSRPIARHRERNIAWAQSAVRQSKSITAAEAQEEGVVEIIARDLDELLAQADGRTVRTPAGETVLRLEGAPVKDVPMAFVETLLQLIAEPDVSYILLTIGTLGLIVGVYIPRSLFPGIAGAICLLTGFAALGMLPVGWAGVVLLVLALILLLAELHAPCFGVFGIGAIAAFLAGSLLLFVRVTPAELGAPDLNVSRWVIGAMTALFGVGTLFVGQRVRAAERLRVQTGAETMIGETGQVVETLDPEGIVRVRGEPWSARSESGTIDPWAAVRVERVEGLVLVVRPASTDE